MNRFAQALVSVVFAAAVFECRAESPCPGSGVVIQAKVQIEPGAGELTLADLLAPEVCPQLRVLSKQVSLGSTPRAGSVRVLEGSELRRLIDELGVEAESLPNQRNRNKEDTRDKNNNRDKIKDKGKNNVDENESNENSANNNRNNKNNQDKANKNGFPERIEVRLGSNKTCAEIARFVASAASTNGAEVREDSLVCAAAQGIPEDSSLELWKSGWNQRLGRQEFALRCRRPKDCVPFLVWTSEPLTPAKVLRTSPKSVGTAADVENSVMWVVRSGQTAILVWEQAGIRVTVPVVCLESGRAGQWVVVRFQNSSGQLRAEVVSAGRVRVRS